MSKRKCSIPKGHKLYTNEHFMPPYNYILVGTNDDYVWCQSDVSNRLTRHMFPLTELPKSLKECVIRVIR